MKAARESSPSAVASRTGFDVERVRRDFPALAVRVHGKPLVYLDNAATSQKPQAVIDALVRYYSADIFDYGTIQQDVFATNPTCALHSRKAN